ncbi:MAG: hypothetical protein LV480_00175 [Methylacidiphilales bacterium]|nr:hypothetical protein [Candidatus Methylacidiphilales bacterium]
MPAFFRTVSLVFCVTTLLLSAPGRAQQTRSTNAPSSTPMASNSSLTTPTDAAKQLINDALKKANANDMDGAMNDLNQAIKLNPNSSGAYVLRASIYSQRKLWPQAEADFQAAARLAPGNVIVKFNLSEIKFIQKQYDVVRPEFVALEKDPTMGDFASYKVFLCDLFAGHIDLAKKELDAFDDGNPSYYFAHAAWSLYYKNIADAQGWFTSASHIYSAQKNNFYAQSLRDAGYLPQLPQN